MFENVFFEQVVLFIYKEFDDDIKSRNFKIVRFCNRIFNNFFRDLDKKKHLSPFIRGSQIFKFCAIFPSQKGRSYSYDQIQADPSLVKNMTSSERESYNQYVHRMLEDYDF